MSEKIKKLPDTLPTEDESVAITRLQPDEVERFHEMVLDNTEHLVAGGLYLHWKYRTPEDVHSDMNDDSRDIYIIRKNDEMAGSLAVSTDSRKSELSRWVDRDFVRQGIATTALRALITQADKQGITLKSSIQAGNVGSSTSIKNEGFARVGSIPALSASFKPQTVYERKPKR